MANHQLDQQQMSKKYKNRSRDMFADQIYSGGMQDNRKLNLGKWDGITFSSLKTQISL